MDNKQPVESIRSEDTELLYRQALNCQQSNDDRQALSYFTQALGNIESIDDTIQYIDQLHHDILLNICDIRIRLYDITQANRVINKALQLANHSQQLDKMAQYLDRRGEIKRLKGGYNSALQDHNKSIEIKLKIHEHEGLDISTSYYMIGRVYADQGRYNDADSTYKKSLKIQLSTLGDNDLSVANTNHSMGIVYNQLGRYDEAIVMLNNSLQIQLSKLGDNHPSIAAVYNSMGCVYENQGRFEDAISIHEKCLKIQLSTLGNNHPNTADTYHNIGVVYNGQGKYDDAISMCRKSLQIKLSVLGDHHPSLIETYNNMGSVYRKQGRNNDAIYLHNKALKIGLSVLGDDHPRVAITYSRLGLAYNNRGDHNDAMPWYEKSLKIELSVLGDNHPNIAATYHNIGCVYNNQGKYHDAMSMLQKSLRMKLSLLGDHHPKLAATYHSIASVYNNQGQYNDALSMYDKSLEIKLIVLGQNHPKIANTYHNIANVYKDQGRYDKAISMCEKALKVKLIAFGNKHPRVANTYNNMGDIYKNQQKFNDAIALYQKAANILVDTEIENQSKLPKIYDKMANCYNKQNQRNKAKEMRQRSKTARNLLQQVDITNKQSAPLVDLPPATVLQDENIPETEVTPDFPNQQIPSQQDSHDGNNDKQIPSQQDSDDSNNDRQSPIQQNNDHALKEKQYFNAYMQAVQQGSCKNKVIRAMYAGPRCVGKSSIMRVFTQQQLISAQDPTQIVDQSDKVVHLQVYKIKDRTTYDLRQIWDNSVHQIVELQRENQIIQLQHENQISEQHISKLTYEPAITHHLSTNDDQQPLAIPSTTTSELSIAETLTPSEEATSTDDHLPLQQYRDFFQHYYPSWLNKTIDDSQYAKIWDFGGHSIYHVTHQPFLSGNSVYILVFNINQNIDDRILTRDGHLLNGTYLQSMQEWLTSIIGSNGNQGKITVTIDNDEVQYSLPIVILVASHGDCIANKQEGIDRFIRYERRLRTKMPCYNRNIYSSRIVFNCNPDDNSNVTQAEREQCSLRLHEIMKSFVQALPFMCNPIPIRWYIMATILHMPTDNSNDKAVSSIINQIRTTRVHKIMTLQEIELLAKDFGLYEGYDELISMLSYLHDLGEVIFCRKGGHGGIIVTDVDWLLHIFRAIIQLQDCPSRSLQMQSLYEKASQTGKISMEYIHHALLTYNLNDQTKESIISLMETYDILCAIKSDNDNDECHYFVPYLLRSNVKPFDLSQYYISDMLYIGYEHDDVPYIPDGIYYCLLSSCLKEWNNTKVELYYHCAKFYITNSRYYIIIKKDNCHIALQYCYQKLDDPTSAKSIKSTVHESIYNNHPQDIVKEKLSSLMNDRMPKFEQAVIRYYVRCTTCDELTFLENRDEDGNLIQCQNSNCNSLFQSRSVNDWIKLNQEDDNDAQDTDQAASDVGFSDENSRYIKEIYKLIGPDWQILAIDLDVHRTTIRKIARQYPDIDIQCYEMLHLCKMHYKANFKSKLIEALNNSDLQEITEKLEKL